MNNETQTAEMELPQIRQMVMENTQRNNRNKLAINKMLMQQDAEPVLICITTS